MIPSHYQWGGDCKFNNNINRRDMVRKDIEVIGCTYSAPAMTCLNLEAESIICGSGNNPFEDILEGDPDDIF